METGYTYEVWYGSQLLHQDEGFETEEDAREEAESYRDTKIKEYDIDGAEYDINEFAIEIGYAFEI